MEIQALGSFKIEFPLQRELDFDVFYRSPKSIENGAKMAAKTEPTSIKSAVWRGSKNDQKSDPPKNTNVRSKWTPKDLQKEA